MKFSDLNLLSVGDTIQMAGAIYSDEKNLYLCFFPEDFQDISLEGLKSIEMNSSDWEAFVRQTDILETEVLAKASDGTLAKIILRKSQRQIDQVVSWKVFKRDSYTCRYCGNNNVLLTVDHLVRWEDGGPSIENNLVTACKKCNRVRGDTPYKDWIRHPYYIRTSMNISDAVRLKNENLVGTLAGIPLVVHKRTR